MSSIIREEDPDAISGKRAEGEQEDPDTISGKRATKQEVENLSVPIQPELITFAFRSHVATRGMTWLLILPLCLDLSRDGGSLVSVILGIMRIIGNHTLGGGEDI
jgi:hypothetical protein